MLGRVIFGPDEDFEKHRGQGALPAMIRLQRQVSFLGDQEGLHGLKIYVSDEQINCQVLRMLWEERTAEHIPYQPFGGWPEVSHTFKDLVQQMMNLDPKKRIAARRALKHPWFEDHDTA